MGLFIIINNYCQWGHWLRVMMVSEAFEVSEVSQVPAFVLEIIRPVS